MESKHITLVKGIVGTVSPLVGAWASKQDIRENLQIASLAIGCCVGLVTIWSILRKTK